MIGSRNRSSTTRAVVRTGATAAQRTRRANEDPPFKGGRPIARLRSFRYCHHVRRSSPLTLKAAPAALDLHGAEVNDPARSGLERRLQHGARALHEHSGITIRAVDHPAHTIHGAANLIGVGDVTEHDVYRKPTDADRTGPAADGRADRYSQEALEHLDDPPADEPAGTDDENRAVRRQHWKPPTPCRTTAWEMARAGHSTLRSWRWKGVPPSPA